MHGHPPSYRHPLTVRLRSEKREAGFVKRQEMSSMNNLICRQYRAYTNVTNVALEFCLSSEHTVTQLWRLLDQFPHLYT